MFSNRLLREKYLKPIFVAFTNFQCINTPAIVNLKLLSKILPMDWVRGVHTPVVDILTVQASFLTPLQPEFTVLAFIE